MLLKIRFGVKVILNKYQATYKLLIDQYWMQDDIHFRIGFWWIFMVLLLIIFIAYLIDLGVCKDGLLLMPLK